MPFKSNTIDDFWKSVDKSGPEVRPGLGVCWIFSPKRRLKSYGIFQMNMRKMAAHRWSYEFANGPFDLKLDVLHACDNPPCVNPAHLSLGSDRENMLDASAKRRHNQSKKTHCPKGHPYAGPNLGMSRQSGRGTWNRVCKKCHSERQSERYRRTKGKSGLFSARAR